MIKLYFQPLQDESFLSKTEVLSLFGNIQDIYSFQQEFLQSLEDAIEGDLESLDTSSQLKVRYIIMEQLNRNNNNIVLYVYPNHLFFFLISERVIINC